MSQKILITGAAGFIGYHLAEKLIARGDQVTGLDNINDYYDPKLKLARLAALGIHKTETNTLVRSELHRNFQFIKFGIENDSEVNRLFESESFDRVINLAAQAGVRYSLENPRAYVDSNIVGFVNILEACRHHKVKHLTYASSSSVYGLNKQMPFSTQHNVDHPISLYAASKKSNELMAHTYSHLYDLPTTGLRFFTVYGPWGRPDMAYFLFVNAILKGEPIKVFNHGEMSRDFTYIDDIVEGIIRVNDNQPINNAEWDSEAPDPSSAKAPYKIYNIGNSHPIKLMDFIENIEMALGKKGEKEFMPMQPGDVAATYADVSDLINNLGYKPETSLEYGVGEFVKWYRSFYLV